MGKLTGAFQFTGTVGGVTVRRDGTVASKPASRKVTAQRTLENNSEFGLAGGLGKLLRVALSAVIDLSAGRTMVARLTQKMLAAIKLDDVNDRGQRQFDKDNSAPLVGFEFSDTSSASTVLFTPRTIVASGTDVTLDIPSLNPATDVKAPQGATHYEIVFGAAALDMEAKTSTTASVASPLAIQALNAAAQQNVSVTASFAAAPPASDLVVGVVGIRFYQQVNNKFYPLANGAYNAGAIEYAG